MAVHIGGRVGASADPAEVLVSSTVKDLVVGSGLRFHERGAADLKGMPGEWRLYALDTEPSGPQADRQLARRGRDPAYRTPISCAAAPS